MAYSQITPTYSVCGAVDPVEIASLAADGFTTIIANRPDAECDGKTRIAIEQEAARHGMEFHYIPFSNGGLTLEHISAQAQAIEGAKGRVLAYCRSGMRSATLWSLAKAGDIHTDEILAATASAGYPLDGLRPQIESLART